MNDIKSYNISELKDIFKALSEPAFRAEQVFSWLHQKRVRSFDEMTNLSKELRTKLSDNFDLLYCRPVRALRSKDGTVKFLFELHDGQVIESVLMSYKHGYSVCVSSQVGCRMGCRFCASTIDGVIRNLTASEMLEEIYEIERSENVTVSNVVIMGSGEPLDNYDNVVKFIRLLSDEKGKNISTRNITLSTCGLVPKIYDLANEDLPITLALSLHAPNDDIRKQIMPIAKAYSIEELMKAVSDYFKETGRRVTFEYSLIDGVNDSKMQAEELAKLVKNMNCHVNLIPVNKVAEREFSTSKEQAINTFKLTLEKYKINVTIRRSMGADIDAACGQLRRSYLGGKT